MKPPTQKHLLVESLCWDGDGSFYPLEAMYDLEGLNNGELAVIWRAIHNRDEPPPSIQRGGARRRIAERLGADEEQAMLMAQQAGPALQQVGRIASKLGVKVGRQDDVGQLSQRLGRVEQELETLMSRLGFAATAGGQDEPGDPPKGDRSRLMAMTEREVVSEDEWGPDPEGGL